MAFEQDRKRAEQHNEYHASSLHNRLISITNNGELIRVGVNAEADGANGMLFSSRCQESLRVRGFLISS